MSMNYIGSISVLERGDSPAQAVLDRNARSLAQRVADETKAELNQVLRRVETIYDNFDHQTHLIEQARENDVEYLNDVAELEELLKDQVKKKLYQQKVTIFIVGYEGICGERLKLMKEVNEFFTSNLRVFESTDEEAAEEDGKKSPEVDLDEVATKVDEALDTAEAMAGRLGDINREMVDWLTNYANAKASNKGKKKLEKSLQQAKEELMALTEKLMNAQQELDGNEERMQQMFKQMEMKNMELQKYKTAAEVAKKNMTDTDALREQITEKDEQIREMRRKIDGLIIDRDGAENSIEQNSLRFKSSSEQNLVNAQQRIQDLENQLLLNQLALEDSRREMNQEHEKQLAVLKEEFDKQLEDNKKQHEEEMRKLLEEKDDEVKDDSDDGKSRRGSRQSSRQRLMGKTKEFAEMAVQDEGGDVDNALVEEGARTSKLMKQKRSGSKADIKDVGEPYPLEDESSWAAVPKPEVSARFNQYRELARDKLAEFEGQIQQTIGRTQRKIASLKEQFSEHKSKWEQERIVLIEQIEAAQNMQSEAEQEADQALQQLEQFIEEQEAVEVDEASRLNELEELSNKLQPIPPPVHSEEVGVGTEDAQTQEQLLQQTDDAKARELERHKSDMTGQAKRHSASTTRLSSAPSRASSSKYRKELEKLRSSAQSRRSKTPQSDLSELKSRGVQGELIEPEDEDSALPDDLKELMSIGVGKSRMSQISAMVGTTPPPSQHNVATAMSKRSGTPSVMEHPVTESFFTIYAAVTAFKDEIARFLMDKDMTSYSQLLQDIEAVKLEPEADVLVQIDNMTRNSQAALDEVQSVFASVVSYERDPVVSSLGGLSRANTFAREKTTESTGRTMGESTSRSRAMSRATDKSAGSGLVDEDALNDVQNAYDKLKDQLEDQARRHQDETNHTTVVMMEMQDTINRLQRELSVAERQRLEAAEPQVDPPQVFTSTDRERNAKTLRRALDEERISAVQYEKSLEDMEEYVRQPAKRVSHLAKKFVHHKQMKQIEESVRQSHCLSDQAFEILDKMEALQNKRAEHWAGEMDVIGAERERLATQLDMTLSSMERDAGVFLIKPTYYIKPRPRVDGGSSKMTRPMRALPPRMLTPMSRSDARSVHDPAPTPASVIAKASSHKLAQTPKLDTVSGTPPLPPLGPLQPALPVTPETGISGSPLKPLDLRGGIDDRQPTFNLASSQITRDTDKQQATGPWMNTPRMLEMDVNRMLIGQNTISARLGSGAGDEVGSANTRGYVTVQRPAGSSSANRSHRPNSHTGLSMDSHPMSSPTNRPESQPLPPINGRPSSASSITIHPSPLAV